MTAPNVEDLAGYGATANVETAAAPGLTNTMAGVRAEALIDTDSNAADFIACVPPVSRSALTSGLRGEFKRA